MVQGKIIDEIWDREDLEPVFYKHMTSSGDVIKLKGQEVLAFARMTRYFLVTEEILTFVRIVMNTMTLPSRLEG